MDDHVGVRRLPAAFGDHVQGVGRPVDQCSVLQAHEHFEGVRFNIAGFQHRHAGSTVGWQPPDCLIGQSAILRSELEEQAAGTVARDHIDRPDRELDRFVAEDRDTPGMCNQDRPGFDRPAERHPDVRRCGCRGIRGCRDRRRCRGLEDGRRGCLGRGRADVVGGAACRGNEDQGEGGEGSVHEAGGSSRYLTPDGAERFPPSARPGVPTLGEQGESREIVVPAQSLDGHLVGRQPVMGELHKRPAVLWDQVDPDGARARWEAGMVDPSPT